MKFLVQKKDISKEFSLVYRSQEYSVDTEPSPGCGNTSILINDLQLEVDEDGEIIYVWGYNPLIQFQEIKEVPLQYRSKRIIVDVGKELIPGISHRLNEDTRWPVYINKKDNWICIGDPKVDDKDMVEFVPNCIAALKGEELKAVWLHPQIIDFE